jgi:GH25 family lysozyme M1 (1,4-beta-N-acetylmuramidase)
MHKATEGVSYKDPNYSRRRGEAKDAGIPFGAYHFARPQRGTAAAEARQFLDVAQPRPGDLRPALDLEVDGDLTLAELRSWALVFIATVQKTTGVKPIVYTPYDLGDAVAGCRVWRPRYNKTNTPPVLPWDIWQFSNGDAGVPNSVPGIGHVDLNTMRPGLTLERLLISPPTSKPVRNRVAEARDLLREAATHRGSRTRLKIAAALKALRGVK